MPKLGLSQSILSSTSINPAVDMFSLHLDGAADYCTSMAAIDLGTVHSSSSWFKMDEATDAQMAIIGLTTSTGYLATVSGSADLLHYHNGTHYVSVTYNPDTNWHHLVVTRDGTAVNFYIDGSLVGSEQTLSSDGAINDKIEIGWRGADGGMFWDGYISDVALYTVELSAPEVTTIYNNGNGYNHKDGVQSANLEAWWRMGDGSGDSVKGSKMGVFFNQVDSTSYGSTLWDTAASTNGNVDNWSVYGTNTVGTDDGMVKITYVDNAAGAQLKFRDAYDLSSDLTVGTFYKFRCDAKVNTSQAQINCNIGGVAHVSDYIANTEELEFAEIFFEAAHATNDLLRTANLGSGEIIWLDNFSLLPLSGNPLRTVSLVAGDIEEEAP
jgi:hypothetical protein